MQIADIPLRLPLPFAAAAGGSFINAIPTASQIGITPGRASLTDGFVPVNFDPVASGGVPPFGGDMNGILNWITLWTQWQNAGGPVSYNAAFSTAIGGYPQGALLNVAGGGIGYWFNLADNNTTNPDAGGANWQQVGYGTTYAGNPNTHVAGVAVSPNSITNSMLWDTVNAQVWICTTTGNAAGAVWTSVSAGASVSVVAANGFNGTVASGAITLRTTVTGMLKGNGTAISAATAGADFVSPSQFDPFSLTSPGYQQLPSGLIMQWGLSGAVPSGSGGLVVTFPEAFPNTCLNVQATFTNAANPGVGGGMNANIIELAADHFKLTQQSGSSSQYLWSALGF